MMEFIVDESISCPQFLPLEPEDVKLTNAALDAAIHLPEVPLSEHIRKEAYYKAFTSFSQAIMADPALIKTEVLNKLHMYDRIYCLPREKTRKNGEVVSKYRFT